MVARTDLATDPQLLAELLTVRRGTAFFARKLNELGDAELDGPSLLPGWTRRHLVAHVGYNARAVTRLVQWGNTGVETPMYASPEARGAEIDEGATLPPRALRHLVDHAAISLDVEWRDTPPDVWARTVRTAQGRVVPLTETVWMRTREVWLHAVDLGNGADLRDVPSVVLLRLLGDITAHWGRQGAGDDLRLRLSDGDFAWGAGRTEVVGDLASVVGWASGRGPWPGPGPGATAPRWI